MPGKGAGRPARPGSRKRRFQRTFAVCPACGGEGIARIPCKGMAECVICDGRGSVEPAVRVAIALAPCEGCLGKGQRGFDECCELCSGLGFMVIDLTPGWRDAHAA